MEFVYDNVCERNKEDLAESSKNIAGRLPKTFEVRSDQGSKGQQGDHGEDGYRADEIGWEC
jgi:hypothetical protein